MAVLGVLSFQIQGANGENYCQIDAVSGFPSITGGYGGDGGPASSTSVRFNLPHGIWLTTSKEMVIADFYNARIRKIDFNNNFIDSFAGNGEKTTLGDGLPITDTSVALFPYGLCGDTVGTIFIYAGSGSRIIRKIDPENIISAVIGTPSGSIKNTGDGGPATSATMGGGGAGCAVDSVGTFYVADSNNNAIRTVSPLCSIF